MKKNIILSFVIAAILAGCSTNYTYPSKKITVEKTGGMEKEYGLLSVRGDSAIVVLDWKEAKVSPIPFSHAETIRNDSITKIVREGKGVGETMVTGARIGFIAGAVITLFLAIIHPSHESSTAGTAFNFVFGPIVFGALFAIPGAFVGAIAGSISPPTKSYRLISEEDRKFLRSISLYPDKEPDEMKYIK